MPLSRWKQWGGIAGVNAIIDYVNSLSIGAVGSLLSAPVTNSSLQDMAQSTVKGRAAGAGTGDPTDLTATQATAILNNVVGDSGSGGTKGLVPAPGAGDAAAGKFLKADGTFAVPPGTSSGGNTISTTAYGSEPGSPSAGDLDLYSNSYYASRYSGSVWVPWGPIFPLTAPSVSAPTTWVNQGGASVDTTFGGIHLLAPTSSGDNLRMRVKTAPSTPYTITAFFLPMLHQINFQACGLCWRQSGDGKVITASLATSTTSAGTRVATKWNSPTSFSADYTGIGATVGLTGIWMQITDNGTDRIVNYSADGQHWFQLHTVGRTDFLTADQVGFFVDTNNTTWTAGMTLLSWKET